MADAKPYSTKMAVSDRLKKDTGELFTDPTTYRSIITSIWNYSEVIALTEDQVLMQSVTSFLSETAANSMAAGFPLARTFHPSLFCSLWVQAPLCLTHRVRPLSSTFWLTGDFPWLISSETVWLSGNVSLCFPVLIRRRAYNVRMFERKMLLSLRELLLNSFLSRLGFLSQLVVTCNGKKWVYVLPLFGT